MSAEFATPVELRVELGHGRRLRVRYSWSAERHPQLAWTARDANGAPIKVDAEDEGIVVTACWDDLVRRGWASALRLAPPRLENR